MGNKKIGRPRKSPDDKRTLTIQFRVNKAEASSLNRQAAKAGKEVSPFIRDTLEL